MARQPNAMVSEPTDPPDAPADCRLPTAAALHEADLFRLWLEQRFPPGALVTTAGAPVRVLYRGRPGNGPGPDFRDARISVGGAPARLGDVELHVTAADFRRHGHMRDPAYRRVVLHVVFDAAGERRTELPGGGSAPVVALRPWAERRSAEIAARLERSAPWREPCHTAVDRLGTPAVVDVLDAAGTRRLRAKAEPIAAELAVEPPEHVLYRAVCGALGLTRNVLPFRMLADRTPLDRLLDGLPDVAAAAEPQLRDRLRATAGFGPAAPALGALPWRLDGLRPNAHPLRRLDGLAALLVRHRQTGLLEALRTAALAGAPELLNAVQVPGIGRSRAVEITVNAVLPFLIAGGDEGPALSLARALPPADAYGDLAVLTGALVPVGVAADRRPLPLTSVLAQQGALGLYKEWCRRGGCGVCPLS